MEGRFNSFQRTMLQWNDLHPYNAVHVVQLAEAPVEARLRDAIQATLEARGLTGLTLSRSAGTYWYEGGPAQVELRRIDKGGSSDASLQTEIRQQLNTAFAADGRVDPFRFFLVPGQHSFALGLAYFHPMADAESIIGLLHDLVRAYQRCPGSPPGPSEGRALLGSVGPNWSVGVLWRKLLALPGQVRDMRAACRVPCQNPQDHSNEVTLFSIDRNTLGGLMGVAKVRGVTLHTLFLALLLHSLASLAAFRRRATRRRRIAIGSVVNLRRDTKAGHGSGFGLCLGSFVVTHPVPEGIATLDLAADLHCQTTRIKRERLYLGSSLELTFARVMMSLFSPDRRRRFYAKHYPLWGGITNVNLNAIWDLRKEAGVLDYLRAVSTGPATPLVLSVTTVRDRAHVSLTYQTAVYSEPQIEGVKRRFLDEAAALGRSV